MKRNGKKIAAGAVLAGAACMAVGFSVAAAKQEAHVVRGEYDFSNMISPKFEKGIQKICKKCHFIY